MIGPLDAHAPYDAGPYRLLAGLGSGGMGTVHLALPPDGGPHDLVAFKTVRQDVEFLADFRLRFRREAEAARAVRGPYVAALVGADPDAERPWLATEYVVGPSLDEAVDRSGPLPVAAVRELGADLARGLAAVHGARLVHRDLKPGNVILGSGGPRLIDFGIAQAYDATALTATGIMVGSPGFMSPEHVAADRSVTSASDVFCLGAVLCFAATGQGPFHDSELAAVVNRIARGGADLSAVPEELREVITSCLHTDPGQRPTTGGLLRTLDPAGTAAARPGVAPARREGPFPWPEGVRKQIGEYEVAVGRALLAPVRAEVPPPPPLAPPEPPPGAHARVNRLGWGIGIAAAAVVGVVTAVAISLWGGGGQNEGGGSGSGGTGGPSAPPAAVTVMSTMSDFGPDATDRAKAPDGWSPWSAVSSEPKEAERCALRDTTLVCSFLAAEPDEQGIRGGWLEARDASDGTPKWRYPAEGTTQRVVGFGPVDIDAERVYTQAPDGDGFAVLDLATGEPVAKLPGEPGYRPSLVRVHEGRIFTSYEGASGEGATGNMLFRAFSADDRKLLWERVINRAYQYSLDVVADGERLHLTSPDSTFALDPATGETVAEVPQMCTALAQGGRYLSCSPSGMRDSATLKKADVYQTALPVGLGRDGTVLVPAGGNAIDPEGLDAVDMETGDRRWTTQEWAESSLAVVADDRVLIAGADDMRSLSLADGKETAGRRSFEGWPEDEAPKAMLVSGGVVFLAFPDGTVLTAHVP
ncbi:serine/threonine-protein kinase [Streptomyces sp. NBC_01725]|uniref:serine/threonine-protein kinase n=1 Tax=Streptomyces sp. NBC_01725 TaxID=2975923 RepID=UPI002E27F0BB|nr:protein kinase [Streptomyces sp. NBC_01725]